MLLLLVCTISALLSILLLMGRSYHLLVALVIGAGSLQAPLMSLSQSSAFQFIDDIPAAFLVLGAGWHVASNWDAQKRRILLVLFAFVLLAAYGFARSPDSSVGFAQGRQVLLPFGLVFAGYVLRDVIQWRKVLNWVVFITILTLAWVAGEEIFQRPLISPTWYYLEVVGGSREGLRQGLPPSYLADGVNASAPVFRPGGQFMNPPIMGFLLGLGAFAAVARLRGFFRILVLAAVGSALYFAYARAGILIFVAVTLVFLIWVKVGKYAAVLVSVILGIYLTSTFLQQGNTASHFDGLLSGLQAGLISPLGLGFGTTGYQAVLEGSETGAGNESLLGLYFAWLGWPMIAVTLVVIWKHLRLLRRLPRTSSLAVWLSLAFILTVASSESASSIASTPLLWFVVGSVLSTRTGTQSQRIGGTRSNVGALRA